MGHKSRVRWSGQKPPHVPQRLRSAEKHKQPRIDMSPFMYALDDLFGLETKDRIPSLAVQECL